MPFGLILLLCVLLMPNAAKAQSVDGLTANQTFDFAALAQQSTTINWGDDYTGFTDNTPKYMGDINGTSLEGRFATGTKSGQGWFLRTDRTPIGLWGRKKLAICGMWNGDRVRITLAQGGIQFLEANSAKMNGSLVTEGQTASGTFVFAAAKDGDVVIQCTDNYTTITKVEFFYSANGYNGSYDVSWNNPPSEMAGGEVWSGGCTVNPSHATAAFSSSNEKVATVDANGVVTAHSRGNCTITAKLDIGPEGNQWSHHASSSFDLTVTSSIPSYNYDPATETYDFYYFATQNFASNHLSDAGFPLDVDDLNAQYLTNLVGGQAVNNRFAISQVYKNGSIVTPWKIDDAGESIHGLQVDDDPGTWHNLSICNLLQDDRVVIFYRVAAKFSSKGENQAYNGCEAFLDNGIDGTFDEGMDTWIENGMSLEYEANNGGLLTSCSYVVSEDGHLDIAIPQGAIISKIIIYSDHQAQMVDRYGDDPSDGNTSYFDIPGQLEAKHHIVPGGLHVYVGNENLDQHAEVVMTDEGPASFVYDENHFKTPNMPNHAVQDQLWYRLPESGTFYKFVPDVDGTMTVRIKANNINYVNWDIQGNAAWDQYGSSNEKTANINCPYYLVRSDDQYHNHQVQWKSNGANITFKNVEVKAGYTYYLFGWWDDPNDISIGNPYGTISHACGVAELIDVTFYPSKYVYPLAKWVESGATASDLSNLATVYGYNTASIKKKSDNIESCSVGIVNGHLAVTDITYKAGANPGGVVLVKVGDKNNDKDPVFALTIAYDANFNYNEATGLSEGYTWNFYERPLNGLKWNNRNAEADVTPFGTYFSDFFGDYRNNNLDTYGIPQGGKNNSSFLKEEYDNGDWTFNYRTKTSSGWHDPRFLNNWDMEGDNADMMWDTQGIIIQAGSTQSCMFNEYTGWNGYDAGGVIDHTNKNVRSGILTSNYHPDRYVGFLKGGSFTIPKLEKDDQIIIYMGNSDASGADPMVFNITNARDALGKVIDSDYKAGGSMWNCYSSAHNDPYYRGCYHFYALEDGDVTFKLVGGPMCKIYEIQIYRGDTNKRRRTNDIARGKYNGIESDLLFINDEGSTTAAGGRYDIHFWGKGESIATPEVLVKSGNLTDASFDSDNITSDAHGYTYVSNIGDFGVFRMRLKDMDYSGNYVCDFADRNFTVGYRQKKTYPYTWDFTDVKNFSSADLEAENTKYPETTDKYDNLGWDISFWDENGSMNVSSPGLDLDDNYIWWRHKDETTGDRGNQLYANDKIIPETQGLWFYMDSNDGKNYNHLMTFDEKGMHLDNNKAAGGQGWWNYKMMIPSVPAGAAVYAHVEREANVSEEDYSTNSQGETAYFYANRYHWGTASKIETGSDTNSKYYQVKVNDPENADKEDYIIAIYNDGEQRDLTLTLNGFIVKKLSVSIDEKKLNKYGWDTESRERVIDPELTAYLTGYPIKTFIPTPTGVDLNARKVLLETVYPYTDNIIGGQGTVMNAVQTDGDKNACILYNTNNGKVEILNGGFHLFVPDMHDDPSIDNSEKMLHPVSESIMKSQLASGTVSMTDGSYTNYVLTYSTAKAGWDTSDPDFPNNRPDTDIPDAGGVGFYRVQPKGVTSSGHQGYIQFLTTDVKPGSNDSNFFSIVFGDEDTNAISNPTVGTSNAEPNYYNLWGQKLNGQPTQRGIYIIGGKKITVK